MFSFVVTIVVVGTCLFVATRIAIGEVPEADKPATPLPRRVRGAARARAEGDDHETEDATARPVRTAVPDPGPEPEPELEPGTLLTDGSHRVPVWQRVRSVVLLAALLTVLGVILALVIAIFGALVLNGLRSAVQ